MQRSGLVWHRPQQAPDIPRTGTGKSTRRSLLLALIACALPLPALSAEIDALLQLSLEELSNLEVTSVSRREESLAGAAASIYVLTSDDIRRSGATTLPEVLRLAPNLQVARIDSVRYAISARGFNNSIGNKLLVLIDGRTVYTSLFSGVFWEMQDTLLQDIERIEVISGPGATLWGANAVNGVINIITRSAADTTGTLLSAEAGTQESGVAVRSGGSLASGWHWRTYAKAREWDNTRSQSAVSARDGWDKRQAGFRADYAGPRDQFTVQGDIHDGESEHRGFVGSFEIPAMEISGHNLLARWNRELADGASFRLQAYWDRYRRDESIIYSPEADTFDLEFQHSSTHGRHQVLWGGGYRRASDDVKPGFFTAILPDSRSLQWQNLFIHDEISLAARWSMIAGVKLEWNDYTGMEYLPTLRLGWDASERHYFWTALSRAVRAPSRYDRDAYFPQQAPFIVAGGPDFEAEVAVVRALGYRGQLSDKLSLAATVFRHDWEKLRSGTPLPLPTFLSNDIEGEARGVEAWLNWQATAQWRLGAGLTTLDKDLRFTPGSSDTAGVNNATLHNDPDYQWQLRSSLDLGPRLMFDLFLRRVAALEVEPVPAYEELTARLAWQAAPGLELALTGNNLLHRDHAEFGPLALRNRIERQFNLSLRWVF